MNLNDCRSLTWPFCISGTTLSLSLSLCMYSLSVVEVGWKVCRSHDSVHAAFHVQSLYLIFVLHDRSSAFATAPTACIHNA